MDKLAEVDAQQKHADEVGNHHEIVDSVQHEMITPVEPQGSPSNRFASYDDLPTSPTATSVGGSPGNGSRITAVSSVPPHPTRSSKGRGAAEVISESFPRPVPQGLADGCRRAITHKGTMARVSLPSANPPGRPRQRLLARVPTARPWPPMPDRSELAHRAGHHCCCELKIVSGSTPHRASKRRYHGNTESTRQVVVEPWMAQRVRSLVGAWCLRVPWNA